MSEGSYVNIHTNRWIWEIYRIFVAEEKQERKWNKERDREICATCLNITFHDTTWNGKSCENVKKTEEDEKKNDVKMRWEQMLIVLRRTF